MSRFASIENLTVLRSSALNRALRPVKDRPRYQHDAEEAILTHYSEDAADQLIGKEPNAWPFSARSFLPGFRNGRNHQKIKGRFVALDLPVLLWVALAPKTTCSEY
jgi:hypothetical protein